MGKITNLPNRNNESMEMNQYQSSGLGSQMNRNRSVDNNEGRERGSIVPTHKMDENP